MLALVNQSLDGKWEEFKENKLLHLFWMVQLLSVSQIVGNKYNMMTKLNPCSRNSPSKRSSVLKTLAEGNSPFALVH